MYKIYETVKTKRKEKLIPGTYDLVFKAIMTSEIEYLADIVSGISGIDKEKIMKNAVIKSSEYIVENIDESKKTPDLVIEVKENIIKKAINSGVPIYKSLYSTHLPSVLFIFFTVIYIIIFYLQIFVYTYFLTV